MATTDAAVPSTPQSIEPFHIEQHGIDFIPENERWAKPYDLFGLWAGASLQVEYFIYGAILMTFGFTFAQAVSIIVIGNISYFLLGICSLQGPDAGTTVFGINRAAYGPNGSRAIATLNWLTMVGFEIEGLILIVGAALVLTMKAGFGVGDPAKAVYILLVVAIQFVLPFLGHATMVKVLRGLIFAIVQLFAINSLDLYSSGVTLQAIGLRVKRYQAVAIDSVLCLGVTYWAVFDSTFTHFLTDFVDLVIIWIAPWMAIYLVDWALRRFRYVAAELQRTGRDGLYRRRGGVYWPAIVAQVLGMMAAMSALFTSFSVPDWAHPVTVHTGGADFSIFLGVAVAGLVYFLLGKKGVRSQADAQDRLLANGAPPG